MQQVVLQRHAVAELRHGEGLQQIRVSPLLCTPERHALQVLCHACDVVKPARLEIRGEGGLQAGAVAQDVGERHVRAAAPESRPERGDWGPQGVLGSLYTERVAGLRRDAPQCSQQSQRGHARRGPQQGEARAAVHGPCICGGQGPDGNIASQGLALEHRDLRSHDPLRLQQLLEPQLDPRLEANCVRGAVDAARGPMPRRVYGGPPALRC
mmetsp:Transcript_97829/g.282251  ORF Transcript_97829/g.282251 Transcript_97829/m.282251 type:complete len:211 (-) Transcript_97829:1710-2342(-)